jgi:hypothetical protein
MILYTFPGYALIGKMVVTEVTMKNPPAALVAVLIFRPSFELFPYKRPCFCERPFGTNALVIVRPAPNNGVECRNKVLQYGMKRIACDSLSN